MSILVVHCASGQCQHSATIAVPNGAWKPLAAALQAEGWLFANGAGPRVIPVIRSVAAGLGRQRLRPEVMITIYARCPRCHERQLAQHA